MPWWKLFALVSAEVLALLLIRRVYWTGFFKVFGSLLLIFSFLLMSRLLAKRSCKSIFKLEIAWCIKVMGQWLLEHGFPHTVVQLAAGVFHIRISCILVLSRISFVVLLSSQLCCVTILWAMDKCSLEKNPILLIAYQAPYHLVRSW